MIFRPGVFFLPWRPNSFQTTILRPDIPGAASYSQTTTLCPDL